MRILKWLAITLATGVALVLIYGTIESRLVLDERHYQVDLPGLSPDLDGLRVAVFSDLQVGMWLANLGMVERIVSRTVESQPDAVLILGDFVYGHSPDVPAQVDTVAELLQPLFEAPAPIFAVLGNHDYRAGAVTELTQMLSEHHVTILENEAAQLPTELSSDLPLYLVGIGPLRPGVSSPETAFKEVPSDAPRVVMMHNPRSFPNIGPAQAPLAVAGHTHCGQIAVPGTPRWSYLGLLLDERIPVDGWAADAFGHSGNRLFVTCGIGFSNIPIRVAAAPQLVFFDLTSTD